MDASILSSHARFTHPLEDVMTLISSDITVRPYTQDDFERIAAFHNLVEPDYPTTVGELRRNNSLRDPKLDYNLFLAERGGDLVGTARHTQSSGLYHPQKFYLNIHVHPAHRRQGLGSRLYTHLLDALKPFDPILLRGDAREDRPDAVRFWQTRGFAEEDRYWESRFDPQTFDPAPYAHLDDKMRELGVDIAPLSALMDAHPDYRRTLYNLDWEMTQDEPLPGTPTRKDFEVYEKYFDTSDFIPGALQVAVYRGAWRGFSELAGAEGDAQSLYNGFTAVGAELRGAGVATALKVKNLVWAKERGYTEIKTWNNARNAPMLAVNTKLGFVRQPAEINFRKVLKEARG